MNEPHGHITLSSKGADVIIGTSTHSIAETLPELARSQAIARCVQAATYYGHALHIEATDPDGSRSIIVHVDGRVEMATPQALTTLHAAVPETLDDSSPQHRPHADQDPPHETVDTPGHDEDPHTRVEDSPASSTSPHLATPPPTAEPEPHDEDPHAYLAHLDNSSPQRESPLPQPPRREDSHTTMNKDANDHWIKDANDQKILLLGRPSLEALDNVSFLQERVPQAPLAEPQRVPWWARLFGRSTPDPAVQRERDDEWRDTLAISQHWTQPRTIAVINGKGGVGKTPATVLLSALFARHGGSGVLAWDTNITRGTLGWRTEASRHHSATVQDLLPHTDRLLSAQARAADLAEFVHHQTIDKFDVLNSNPLLLSTDQMLTPEQLDDLHAVATKYYRLVLMDSGNDEGAALWLRMIDHADQIVVPTSTRLDHAEAARLLLHALHERNEHSRRLAQRAVVIVSQADREEADASQVAQTFSTIARSVVTIPYDPAMRQQWLQLDSLQPATRRAYLRAAAAIAGGI